MKQAAADKKGSPASQKYDKSDTDERVYDIDQKKYDKFRSTQGKKFPDIRYLGKKENKKFLEEYLKRKDNKIVSKSISKSDKGSPAPQKSNISIDLKDVEKASKKARKFSRKANKLTDKANKYIKRKGKDASMVVDETGETVERYELKPRHKKRASKKVAKAMKAFGKAKGVEAELMSKYLSPASQKMSYKEAFEYLEKGDKSDKKKTRKAKRTVKKSIKKGKMMKGEAFPGHFNQVPKSMYREGTEENKKMKERLAKED